MRKLFIFLSVILLAALPCVVLNAQQYSEGEFKILSFKRLSWDLDARINHPVIDQNGKKTALIKVITGEKDFSFDVGIMGVTEVRQENGEIWVYVPEHVRKITIRHKTFGVIRDFFFTEPIESAVTYEILLKTPETAPVVKKEIVIKDSIIYVPTVPDSSAFTTKPKRQPFGISVSAIYAVPVNAAGAMLSFEKFKWGGYLKAVCNFRKADHSYDCHSDGTAGDSYIWTTGQSRTTLQTITCGAIFKATNWLNVYAGGGYGNRTLLWEDTGGDWARVTDRSPRGICVDAGAQFKIRRFRLTAGASSISFKTINCEIGIGFCF